MGKPEVHRFFGKSADVILTLTHSAQEAEKSDHGDCKKRKKYDHGANDGERETPNTEIELLLSSTVLKDQSEYFEAFILRWSKPTPSGNSETSNPGPWRYTYMFTNLTGSFFSRDCALLSFNPA